MLIQPVYIGLLAGILTSVSMVPQLVKIIRQKKAGDISVVMLLVLISGLALWSVYGVMIKDIPLLVTNGFACLLNMVMLFFSIKYKNN